MVGEEWFTACFTLQGQSHSYELVRQYVNSMIRHALELENRALKNSLRKRPSMVLIGL